ncbi:hypothetical protein HWV62_29220 [Athelia sp. TMB]|nr:hypothetical protein HWV62_29220 [Athelia sp. TMB]
MHPALQVKELFLGILEQLNASADNMDKQSLTSLTVVCREWHEPALDALWRTQRMLLPLLKTFPAHKWNMGEDKSFTITEALDDDDWLRFGYFAGKMRHIIIRPEEMDQPILSLLRIRSQFHRLFTNLTSLEWESYFSTPPVSFLMMTPFMGMSLRHLAITFAHSQSSPPAGALLLFSGLNEQAPSLKRLEIRGEMAPHVANAAFNAALSLPKLDTFLVEDNAITTTLLPLSQLDHLRELSLKLDETILLTDITADYLPTTFHSLETVHLNTTAPSFATMFILKFLAASPLREFTLAFYDALNQDHAMQLSSAMAHVFPHNSMTTIRVWGLESARAPRDNRTYVLDVGMLRNLFVFRNLQVFTFNVKMNYGRIDEKFIGDLATDWPALRALSLVPTGTPCSVISLPLEGLIHFTKSRNLIYLNVLFDGNNLRHNPPANGLSCSSLRHLNVHASSLNIRDLDAVANLIFDMFPNLTDIKYLEPSIVEEDGSWRAMLWRSVNGRYTLFKEMREHVAPS